jgi:hypothetical protein
MDIPLARLAMQHACSPPSTPFPFQIPVGFQEQRDAEVLYWFGLFGVSLSDSLLLPQQRMQKKKPTQYLLTIEKRFITPFLRILELQQMQKGLIPSILLTVKWCVLLFRETRWYNILPSV